MSCLRHVCLSVVGVRRRRLLCLVLICPSLPSCSWYMTVCSDVLCVCCQSVLLVVLAGGLSLVHELSSRSFYCRVRMIWW